MLKIPASAAKEAAVGLAMKEAGYDGGREQGLARALTTQESIPVDDAKVVWAWFQRPPHPSRPGYLQWKKDGMPTAMISGMKSQYRGAVAWLIWGGDSAYEWITRWHG
jgi:hypothetical protein